MAFDITKTLHLKGSTAARTAKVGLGEPFSPSMVDPEPVIERAGDAAGRPSAAR